MKQSTCALPNCARLCHPGFQYCGVTHEQIHQHMQQHSMQEQAPSWKGLTRLSSEGYKGIEWLFENQWKKGTAPIIRSICKIDALGANFSLHRDNARQHGNVQLLFHGTNQTCSIGETNILCPGSNCNTCSIIRTGWKKEYFGSATGLWGRFGKVGILLVVHPRPMITTLKRSVHWMVAEACLFLKLQWGEHTTLLLTRLMPDWPHLAFIQ